jgi:hypothetical protein
VEEGRSPHGGFLRRILPFAAFLFALAGALGRPLWFDELFTLRLARLPPREILASLVEDSGPPLHYFLAHGLFLLFRWEEGSPLGSWLVRLPSALAYALLVALIARVGDRRSFPWGALLAFAWLPLLFFGGEARAYVLLSLAVFAVGVEGGGWLASGKWGILAFVAVAAAVPLLHNTGYVQLGAFLLIALTFDRPLRGRALAALGVASLPAIGFLPVLLEQPRESVAWMLRKSAFGIPGRATFDVLAPAGPFPPLFEAPELFPPWLSRGALLLLIAGLLLGIAAPRLFRKGGGALPLPRGLVRRLFLAGSAPLLLAVAATAGLPLYFAGRTEAALVPPLAALAGLALARLPPRLATLFAAPWVIVGLATEATWLAALPSHPPSPGVAIVGRLLPVLEPGDRFVAAGLWELELRHGLAALGATPPEAGARRRMILPFPESLGRHPGWLDSSAFSPSSIVDARRMRQRLEGEGSRRIWVVGSPALPLETSFFPAFAGWKRHPIHRGEVVCVDLLVAP